MTFTNRISVMVVIIKYSQSFAGVACGPGHRRQNEARAGARRLEPDLESKNPLFNRETCLVSEIHTFLDSGRVN